MIPRLLILVAALVCLAALPALGQEAESAENPPADTVIDLTEMADEDAAAAVVDTGTAEAADAAAGDAGTEDPEPARPHAKPLPGDEVLMIYVVRLFEHGRYEEALEVCDLLLANDSENDRLLNIKGQILLAQRQVAILRQYVDTDEAINEVITNSRTPLTPDPVTRPAADQVIELVSGMNREQREAVKVRLNQKISLNVVDAQLAYVLNLLFRGTGINIIADQSVLAGKQLTIQVEGIPLEGVLNYISRLEGITYSISHETVWITTSDKPMHETRIIRLRSGLTDVLEQLDVISTGASAKPGAAPQGKAGWNQQTDVERLLSRIADVIDWPTGSNWVLDRKTNSLFVRSTSDALDKFETIIKAIDIAPLQVLIEAKFVEISDGDLHDVGIEWQLANNSRIQGIGGSQDGIDMNAGSGTNFGFSSRKSGVIDFSSNFTGMDLFLTGVLTGPEFEAVIHAVNTKDSSHTLSSPTLLTINNFLGTIQVTTDLVYIESYTVDRSKTNQNATVVSSNTATYTLGDDDGDGVANEDGPDGIDNDNDGNFDEDGLPWDSYSLGGQASLGSEPVIIPVFATEFEGVILKVLPSIGIDGRIITLTLQPEVTEQVGQETFNLVIPNYTGTAEIKRPIMNRRTFVTKLSVEDGSTVVLGGLKKEKDIKMVSRVPILGNIPLLGRLFSRTYTNKVATNLLIFVTAHVLEPSGSMYKKDDQPRKVVSITTPDGRIIPDDELKRLMEAKRRRK